MKFDVVMCVKNGKSTLPAVLKRIDAVIPRERVHLKIMVDDGSVDGSGAIGASFGWQVFKNRGKGLSDALNTGLGKVETPIFCLFEQDVVLSPSWFREVFPLIFQCEDVVAASGNRFVTAPAIIRQFEIELYQQHKARKTTERTDNYCHTFDNTVVKTAFLREIGGFAYIQSNSGQDTDLSFKILSRNKRWLTKPDVISTHVKPNSLRYVLQRELWYATKTREILSKNHLAYRYRSRFLVTRVVKAPLSTLKLLYKMRNPVIVLYYPTLTLVQLVGYIKGGQYELQAARDSLHSQASR